MPIHRPRRAAFAFVLAALLGALPGPDTRAQAARPGKAGGVAWSVPPAWTEGPGGSMRVATYRVPAAGGAEPGEVAVFFFGPGQGGSVDANVERWSSQFEGSPRAERSEKRVSGLGVTLVRIAGTYLAPGGPMMQSQGARPDYRLLGAIVEAPGGLVFFKLTGPAPTIAAAQAAFDALVASLARG